MMGNQENLLPADIPQKNGKEVLQAEEYGERRNTGTSRRKEEHGKNKNMGK